MLKITTLPVIEYAGITAMGELVEKRIKALNIENLVASEETIKSLKEMRAKLNNEFKEYEAQRMAIKDAISNPYLQFDAQYKLHISKHYSEAESMLKDKILLVESKLKLAREAELKEFFIDTCMANEVDFVKFEQVGLNITMSASMKSFKDAITTFVTDKAKEVTLINALDATDNYKIDVLVEYKKSLNLPESIRIVKARKEAKQAEEERMAASPGKAPVQPQVIQKPIETPLKAPVVEVPEEVFEMNFSVIGTLNQLKGIKAYLIANEIKFSNI